MHYHFRVFSLIPATIVAALLLVSAIPLAAMAETPLTSAFSYQGQLKSNGSPANGSHNLEFRLFDALTLGNQIGSPVTLNGVSVTNGLFTVQLNSAGEFGATAFNGSRRWLEIRVNGSLLTPRQELTGSPFAMYSLAGPVSGASPWQVNGTNAYYNNGNVGVGTSTPGMSLEVTRPSYYGKPALGASDGSAYAFLHVTSSAQHSLIWDNARDMRFGTETSRGAGYAERMRIGANGNVAIGDANTGIARLMVGNWNTANGPAIYAETFDSDEPAIRASNSVGGANAHGVYASSSQGTGVLGVSNSSYGVKGESQLNDGLQGTAHASNRSGIWGNNDGGGTGVAGSSTTGTGVSGNSDSGRGVTGVSNGGDGVYGQSSGQFTAGVSGVSLNGSGYGAYFANNAGGIACYINGRATVKVLEVLGADVAERFPVSACAEPGTVMEIDPDHPGTLRVACGEYNRRVVGVISGAGDLPAGAILGNLPGNEDAPPIALSGRVYVHCDATNAPIEPGDLLTTSDTPGHAMCVTDHVRAQGAVIGKAMTRLEKGQRGLVLVLVSLQ